MIVWGKSGDDGVDDLGMMEDLGVKYSKDIHVSVKIVLFLRACVHPPLENSFPALVDMPSYRRSHSLGCEMRTRSWLRRWLHAHLRCSSNSFFEQTSSVGLLLLHMLISPSSSLENVMYLVSHTQALLDALFCPSLACAILLAKMVAGSVPYWLDCKVA